MILAVSLSGLVAIVGVLMYALSANPKVMEIGRISFHAGLFTFLLSVGAIVLTVPHR
jgi:hypothetical protein